MFSRPWESAGTSASVEVLDNEDVRPESAGTLASVEVPDNEDVRPEAQDVVDKIENNPRIRHHLHADAKLIVRNVHKKLVEKGCPSPIKVTSELTDVPYTTVQKIINNPNLEKKQRASTKFAWKNCIRHVIDIENSYISPQVPELIINLAEDTDDENWLGLTDDDDSDADDS